MRIALIVALTAASIGSVGAQDAKEPVRIGMPTGSSDRHCVPAQRAFGHAVEAIHRTDGVFDERPVAVACEGTGNNGVTGRFYFTKLRDPADNTVHRSRSEDREIRILGETS